VRVPVARHPPRGVERGRTRHRARHRDMSDNTLSFRVVYNESLLIGAGMLLLIAPQAVAFAFVPPKRHWTIVALGCLSLCGDVVLVIAWFKVGFFTAGSWSAGLFVLVVCAVTFLGCLHVTVYLLHRGANKIIRMRRQKIEGDLPHVLEEGDMRLLSVAWLMAQPADFVLPRRQVLDTIPGALLPAPTARRRLHQGRVAVLSYRWLRPNAPDPDGFHIAAVRSFFFDPAKPLTSAWRQLHYPALFIDHASCFQKGPQGEERSAEERESFSRCLNVMTNLYGSPATLVLQVRVLHRRAPSRSVSPSCTYMDMGPMHVSTWLYTLTAPRALGLVCAQHKALPHSASQQPCAACGLHALPTYEQSGWCSVEQAVASLASGQCYELGRGWVDVSGVAIPPGKMRDVLATKRFTGKADEEQVCCPSPTSPHHQPWSLTQGRRGAGLLPYHTSPEPLSPALALLTRSQCCGRWRRCTRASTNACTPSTRRTCRASSASPTP
jgi:hypothetical protein